MLTTAHARVALRASAGSTHHKAGEFKIQRSEIIHSPQAHFEKYTPDTIDLTAKKGLDDAVLDILNDPSIGEEKAGELAGVFVHKFKINKQLILLSYTYDENEINLLTFGSHENFYRDLKKYKKA